MRLLSASVLKNWNPSTLMIPDRVEPMFRLLRGLPNFPEVWSPGHLPLVLMRQGTSKSQKYGIPIMKLLFSIWMWSALL